MTQRDAPAQALVIVILARPVSVVGFGRQAVRLIENVWLGETDARIRLLRARLDADAEILPGADERAIGEDIAGTRREVGDVEIPLLVGEIAADAAIAVDAGAHIETRRLGFGH